MALAAVGSNLITFVFGELHFPLSQAANVVTNFVGTVFILSPLGGFLSDSYAGCFWTLLAFAAVELAVRATVRSTTTYILLITSSQHYWSFLPSRIVPLLPSLLFFGGV
jgi:nitrate/nitrite transporter NarK